MGPTTLNPEPTYAWPTILVEEARKLTFGSLTPLFVYGNLSIEKTRVTLC